MRSLISLLFSLGLVSFSYAQSPPQATSSAQVIAGPFNWKTDLFTLSDLSDFLRAGLVFNNGAYDDFTLDLVSSGKTPAIYTLRTLGSAVVSQIGSKHYAIVGRLRYAGMAPGSFLEMENWFAPEHSGGPEGCYFSRTLGDAGPMAKMEGSDDGRDFALPFDATGAKTSLDRLVLKLHTMGPGELWLSNVRLVQYPDTPTARADSPVKAPEIILTLLQGTDGVVSMDGTAYSSGDGLDAALKSRLQENPDTAFVIRDTEHTPYEKVKQLLDWLRQAGAKNIYFATNPLGASDPTSLRTVTAPSSGFNFRSFWLGVLTALLAIVAFTALFSLGLRFRNLRHARELRRIASLDG